LHGHPVDEVIFAIPTKDFEDVREMMDICEVEGVKTRIISDFFSGLVFKAEADVIHGIPIITYSPAPRKEGQLLVKRVLDIGFSFTALVLLSPLFAVVAVAIKLTSPGPVFYSWKVVGLNKRPFAGYKFRTMVVNADKMKEMLLDKNEMNGPVFKLRQDPRVTRVGRFLRKYSLDELPQLWSVLKGDMSLVGPHPPLETELCGFQDWHWRKLSVKPGVTCLWQVSGRNEIREFDDWVKMDLDYIDNWSLSLDLKILLKTIPAVLSAKGAS
jgi:exopolysaccharide biosynthesis polyprenyl glycosylphosphotransferase